MNASMSSSKVVSNDNERIFTYTKSKLGFGLIFPMLWPSLFVSAFIAYYRVANSTMLKTVAERFSMGFAYWIFFTILIPVLVVLVINLFRLSGSFKINNEGFVVNGTPYPIQQFQQLYIKTPHGLYSSSIPQTGTNYTIRQERIEKVPGTGIGAVMGVLASGIMGSASKLSNASGEGMVKAIRNKSFKICFKHNGKEITLARQMSEAKATELLNKINSGL